MNFSHESVVDAYEQQDSEAFNRSYLQAKEIVELKALNKEWRSLRKQELSK